jgi:hypothetical protein
MKVVIIFHIGFVKTLIYGNSVTLLTIFDMIQLLLSLIIILEKGAIFFKDDLLHLLDIL